MSILKNAKDIADLIKKIGDIELYRKIVELEGEIIELTRENRTFQERVEQLESQIDLSKKMEYREPFWFAEGDKTPCCPRCWENDKKAIHLLDLYEDNDFKCPQCDKVFHAEDSSF